jgi:predicted SprT family Zn-dependent metalloprotease
MTTALDPTRTQFQAYSLAFDYFNRELFNGKLPPCMLNFSRKAKAAGFFAPKRWRRGQLIAHEISLNPDVLTCEVIEMFQTLVHEMAHLWQQEFGKPSRSGYHNTEWADLMEAIGLMPSSTGAAGGKRTGQHMADYVIRGGRFHKAFFDITDDCVLPWLSGSFGSGTAEEGDDDEKKKNKIKYTCPRCEANVWGKPDLHISCDDCMETFQAQD